MKPGTGESHGQLPAGRLLLHPVALFALFLLVANDHVFKALAPSWLTGKMSDAAGLIVAPLVLAMLIEVLVRPRPPGAERARLLGATLVIGFGFTAVKLLPEAADAYRVGLGVAQWPIATLATLPTGALPSLRPVALAMDASDLLTLPAVLVPLAIGWGKRAARGKLVPWRDRAAAILLAASTVALVGTSQPAPLESADRWTGLQLTMEDPRLAREFAVTANAAALSLGGERRVEIRITVKSGRETVKAPEVGLAVVGIQPGSAVLAAREAWIGGGGYAALQAFAGCPESTECEERYRVEVTWLEPAPQAITIDLDVGVSFLYPVFGTRPRPTGEAISVRLDPN